MDGTARSPRPADCHRREVPDGGGIEQAVPNPVAGADKVARLFVGGLRMVGGVLAAHHTTVNGHPALVVTMNGELDGIFAAQAQGGQIMRVYHVRNPEKLSHVDAEIPLTRL